MPFTKILALNKPEWPYLVVGTFASLVGGAVYPCVAILFAKIIGVSVLCVFLHVSNLKSLLHFCSCSSSNESFEINLRKCALHIVLVFLKTLLTPTLCHPLVLFGNPYPFIFMSFFSYYGCQWVSKWWINVHFWVNCPLSYVHYDIQFNRGSCVCRYLQNQILRWSDRRPWCSHFYTC